MIQAIDTPAWIRGQATQSHEAKGRCTMKKHSKHLLAMLLMLAMLVSTFSGLALADEIDDVITENDVTTILTDTEGGLNTPSTEPIEEPTEELAEETVEKTTEEVTEETATESTEELTEEVTEKTVEESTEEATKEPTEELSEEQLSALNNLPEGFDAQVVGLAMLGSSGCQHTNLWVENILADTENNCTKIDDEKHSITYVSRKLQCRDCGETLQSIASTASGNRCATARWISPNIIMLTAATAPWSICPRSALPATATSCSRK